MIRKIKPERLLCSYWYFRNKTLASFCEAIGYVPEILLDSGAYSAYTKGKNVNLLNYMEYIRNNEPFITRYVALDIINDEHNLSHHLYQLMVHAGLSPLPVFHYHEDLSRLEYYRQQGARTIALGGTVPIRDKERVASWCEDLSRSYPDIQFHLLGSTSEKLLRCSNIVSCDSSAWYLLAINGKPKTIQGTSKEAKLTRAEENMIEIMRKFDGHSVSNNHRII